MTLECGGTGTVRPRSELSGGYIGGVSSAVQAFQEYFRVDSPPRNVDLDVIPIPQIEDARAEFKTVLRCSQRATDLFSAAALGVLLPQLDGIVGDESSDQVECVDYEEMLKGDPEPSSLFKKLNGLYHQSWVQFNVRDNCVRDIGPAYLRMDSDLQSAVLNEMTLGNHSEATKTKARNPENHLSLLKDFSKQGGCEVQKVFSNFRAYRSFLEFSTRTIKTDRVRSMYRSNLGERSAAFLQCNPGKMPCLKYSDEKFMLLLRKRLSMRQPCVDVIR